LIPQISDIKLGVLAFLPKPKFRSPVTTGLAGAHQRQNASLAVHLAHAFLQSYEALLPEPFVTGLEKTRWPGRCQTVTDPKHPNTTWFLDGAHTVESLDCCMQWFFHPDVGLRPP
jgi:folylpolyglutamate synthase